MGERGETLVETLLSVAMLGLLATAIIAALFTTTSVSDLDAKQSAGEPALRSYAEAWRRATYESCTAGSSANPYGTTTPPGFTAPAGFTASITAIKFWDGTSSNPVVFNATCPAAGDQGLQEITLEVDHPRGTPQTLTILRRET